MSCDCGFISCVCKVYTDHMPWCKFRISMTCPVAVTCEHGVDVCPACDPCTCNDPALVLRDAGVKNSSAT